MSAAVLMPAASIARIIDSRTASDRVLSPMPGADSFVPFRLT
jgi:hypothetical protein